MARGISGGDGRESSLALVVLDRRMPTADPLPPADTERHMRVDRLAAHPVDEGGQAVGEAIEVGGRSGRCRS